jgi:hypothetical protein
MENATHEFVFETTLHKAEAKGELSELVRKWNKHCAEIR